MKYTLSVCLGLLLAGGFFETPLQAAVFDVKTFGAVGEGKTTDTAAINKAIDAAHAAARWNFRRGPTDDNIAMRDIVNSPIFIRLGSRQRGPGDPAVGVIRRINISNIVCSNSNWRLGSIISGIPGHPIEDVHISNVHFVYQGGGTKEDAAIDPPEKEGAYPDPGMFGTMPAYGFFVRHVKGLEMDHVDVSYAKDEMRPAIVLNDVAGADFDHLKARRTLDVPFFGLHNVSDFTLHNCPGLTNTNRATIERGSF